MPRPVSVVPTFDRLMWPTLKALKVMGGSASNEELLHDDIYDGRLTTTKMAGA